MSNYEQIALDVSDGVATITMDRPDQLNAFTGQMLREMVDAFDRTDGDDDVRAVIVTGRGRAFCAGADLAAGGSTFAGGERPDAVERASDRHVASGGDRRSEHRDGGGILSLRIYRSIKPVIAAINGPAVGVGVTMTLPMDIRLAVPTAKIGFVFGGRGIVPEACSTWFLPRVVGISKALEWCYTARVFLATEAHEAGLVAALHEPDDLMPAATALAAEIAASSSPLSVSMTRQMLWRMLGEDHPMAAHRVDSRAVRALGSGPDSKEGVEAFLAKRPAAWTTRPSVDMPDFVPWWDEPGFH
jgi:enoyl-CoA hydratase/carnithine racemase